MEAYYFKRVVQVGIYSSDESITSGVYLPNKEIAFCEQLLFGTKERMISTKEIAPTFFEELEQMKVKGKVEFSRVKYLEFRNVFFNASNEFVQRAIEEQRQLKNLADLVEANVETALLACQK